MHVRFIDSHLHLTEYDDLTSIVGCARSSETLLLTTSLDKKTSLRNLELGTEFPDVVRPFVGIHPSEASREEGIGWIEGSLWLGCGVGETGLDPRYSEVSESSAQMRIFSSQLELAEKAGKPVQVHSRGAEEACLEKLSSYHLRRVLLHWFEGESLSSSAASRGYYASFGPAILQSKKVARIAASYPEDLVLTESDGPVAFSALRGACGPSLIPSVVFCLAELRKKQFAETARGLVLNGSAYLG